MLLEKYIGENAPGSSILVGFFFFEGGLGQYFQEGRGGGYAMLCFVFLGCRSLQSANSHLYCNSDIALFQPDTNFYIGFSKGKIYRVLKGLSMTISIT